jgi:hypothetical protein
MMPTLLAHTVPNKCKRHGTTQLIEIIHNKNNQRSGDEIEMTSSVSIMQW